MELLADRGMIIKAKPNIPGITHYGILVYKIFEPYVLHNTPGKGTICEPLKSFLRTRSILEKLPSPLQRIETEEIMIRFANCKGDYDLINYNCEHFIHCMIDSPNWRSPQVLRGLVLAGIVAVNL